MPAMTVTNVSKLAYASVEGTATRPDRVSIRITDQTGTVYFRKTLLDTSTPPGYPIAGVYAAKNPASTTQSMYVQGAEVYSVDLVAGEALSVIVASGTEEIRISGEINAIYGT